MQRQNYPTSPIAHPKAVVGGKDGLKYRFTVLTSGLVRYEYADDGVFEDRASSFVIHRDLPVPEFHVVDQEDGLQIYTEKFHLYYDKKPFDASGLSAHIKGNVTDWKNMWRYGGGIYQEEYQLHGTARTLDEANGRIPLQDGVLSRNGYSTIDDSESMLFMDDGNVSGRRPGHRIDGYLFTFGWDLKQAMKDFYAVSGKQPLIPRWALGNWWSRYYQYTDKSYIELMNRFRDEDIPFSVGVLDMDWHWVDDERVDKSGFTGWTGYSWNTNLFPDPKKFLNELHDRGIKITPNDHPADGIASYEDVYPEVCKALGLDANAGEPIKFDIANSKFRDAYFDIVLKKLEDDGIDFWWIDWQQGVHSSVPGVDPLWVLNHFHFLNNTRGNTRPLTFSRFGGPGSHRYPVGFSGDSVVTWESLDFQPEFTATSSNIGYGWWSHDIGGHMKGYRDDELAARWVQHGVFSPILRLHSSNNPWNAKEPWRFTPEARHAMNHALRLRHKLIPYLYSMNVRSAKDGEPLVQPVYWSYPKNDDAYRCPNTYFFGSELFVCPLTSPRQKITRRTKTKAWLPPGRWVDINSGVVYDGDRFLWFYRTLDEYAVFAREGSIVPLDAAKKPKNGADNPTHLEIKVVIGKDTSFNLYEDDGHGSGVAEVDWITTPITLEQNTGVFKIGPASKESDAIPQKRTWIINFIALPEHTSFKATVDGKEHELETSKTSTQGVTITIADVPITSEIHVSLGKNPQLAIRDPTPDLFTLLDDAQMDFDPKQAIWATLTSKKSLVVQLAELHTYGYDPELVGAFSEHMCADTRYAIQALAKKIGAIDGGEGDSQ